MQRLFVFFLTLIFGGTFTSVQAQETWSLQRCIEHAQQNNILLKQAAYNVRNAELTIRQNKFERLPSVNGSISGGVQFGRTIDPTTNSFGTQTIGSNRLSLDIGLPIYNGGQIKNSITQSEIDLEVAKLNGEVTANDLALQIANAYLNILLAEEQLENALKRIALSQEQLDQTDKRIAAGTLPEVDRLDFVAQIAADRQSAIQFENQAALSYLTLTNLLQLEPDTEIRIQEPEVMMPAVSPENFGFSEIYAQALQTQPQIEANELQEKSAALDIELARAGMLPSINFFGSLNSNFSTFAIDRFVPTNEFRQAAPIPAIVGGESTQIVFFEPTRVKDEAFYFDQINENFGQSIGLNINLPIYNRHRNILQMERARLGVLNQEVTTTQAKLQLSNDVQQAIASVQASKRSLEAAELSLQAAQAAFENAQRRFDLGTINSLEYTTARNTLDQAQVELTRSKYEYLFNVKIVEFYQGKQLTLD